MRTSLLLIIVLLPTLSFSQERRNPDGSYSYGQEGRAWSSTSWSANRGDVAYMTASRSKQRLAELQSLMLPESVKKEYAQTTLMSRAERARRIIFGNSQDLQNYLYYDKESWKNVERGAGNPGTTDWSGLCHQWASAATDEQVKYALSQAENGILCGDTFISHGELKELFTKFYKQQSEGFWGYKRSKHLTKEQREVLFETGIDDLAPDVFEKQLLGNLRKGSGAVVDHEADFVVWNMPVDSADVRRERISLLEAMRSRKHVRETRAKVLAPDGRGYQSKVRKTRREQDSYGQMPTFVRDTDKSDGRGAPAYLFLSKNPRIMKTISSLQKYDQYLMDNRINGLSDEAVRKFPKDFKANKLTDKVLSAVGANFLTQINNDPDLSEFKNYLDKYPSYKSSFVGIRRVLYSYLHQKIVSGEVYLNPKFSIERVSLTMKYARASTVFGASYNLRHQKNFKYLIIRDELGRVVDSSWLSSPNMRPDYIFTPKPPQSDFSDGESTRKDQLLQLIAHCKKVMTPLGYLEKTYDVFAEDNSLSGGEIEELKKIYRKMPKNVRRNCRLRSRFPDWLLEKLRPMGHRRWWKSCP